jgi:16S rRNA (uracil1498-N3)-methyltransferase
MEYFYTPPQLITKQELVIEGDEFSHLTHVMRRKTGDAIRVVDGAGNAYDATIAEISKRSARCSITAHHARLNEPDFQVTIAAGILKNASKFDFLVEKVTELGVSTIVPLHTERTIPQHAKVERWRKLALAAMKQSGRCVIPAVQELTTFSDFIHTAAPESLKIIPHEKTMDVTLSGKFRQPSEPSIVICIGPEGGFTDEEVELATKAGFIPVSLGPRRLRTETAAIAAVAAILT